MAQDDANLGFSVDTSGLDKSVNSFNNMEKAAKSATDQIDKMTDSISKAGSGDGMHSRGFYSGLQSTKNKIVEEITDTGEEAGKGFWSKFFGGLSSNHIAQRELTTMSHEALSGNFGRLRGSASIFLSSLGMGGLASAGVMVGGTMLLEGISSIVEEIQAAKEATEELNTAAIVSGNESLLNPQTVNGLIGDMGNYNDQLDTTAQKLQLAKEAAAGLSAEQMKLYNPDITRAGKLGLDPAKVSEMFEDPLKNITSILTTFKGQISQAQVDQLNKLMQAGKYQEAEKTLIQDMSGAIEVMNAQYDQTNGKLQTQLSLWDQLTANIAKATVSQGGNIQGYIDIDNDEKRRTALLRLTSSVENFQSDIRTISEVTKATDKSISESGNLANKFTSYSAPKTHHGLTDAERKAKQAAEELARFQRQISDFDDQINQSSRNQMNSLNRSFESQTYKFSMTGDQYKLMVQIEQANERAQNEIDQLNRKYADAKRPHDAGYAKSLADINAGTSEYIQKAKDDYEELQTMNQSALMGMHEGWESYYDSINNLAEQSATTYKDIMGDMQDELINFLETGKLDIDKFLKAVAEDIEKMLVEHYVMAPINNFVGGLFGWGSSGSSATNAALSANSMSVPSYSPGGLGATQSSGFGNIVVNVNNMGGSNVKSTTQADKRQGEELGRQLQKFMDNYVKQQNVNSNRQGGTNKQMGNWSTK